MKKFVLTEEQFASIQDICDEFWALSFPVICNDYCLLPTITRSSITFCIFWTRRTKTRPSIKLWLLNRSTLSTNNV
jgi:hypothetical protein